MRVPADHAPGFAPAVDTGGQQRAVGPASTRHDADSGGDYTTAPHLHADMVCPPGQIGQGPRDLKGSEIAD
jgi:hypothetical protein